MGLLTSLFLRLHIFLSVTEETPVQRHIDENNYKVCSATSYFSLCFSCFPANILLTWVCGLSGLLKLLKFQIAPLCLCTYDTLLHCSHWLLHLPAQTLTF